MNVDLELFYFFNHSLQNPVFDVIMPFITHLGGFEVLVVVLIAVIIYAHLKNKKTLKRLTILALIAFLCSDIVTAILKHIVNEPRPFVSLDNVRLMIVENDPLSFPSGHATSTLSFVTFFVLNMKELSEKHYRLMSAVLILFAVTIPFSRMYVGVHYPHDVLAGVIIGIVGAVAVNRYKNRIIEN